MKPEAAAMLSGKRFSWFGHNPSTRISVTIMGVLTAVCGSGHGVAEIFQGSRPPVDIGTRIGAVTVLPDYFVTGVVAVILSLVILVWTVGFFHRKHGASVYLVLSVALFLSGGGVAQTAGILVTFAAATRINAPLRWWKGHMPTKLRKFLTGIWFPAMVLGYLLILTGIFLWIFLMPPGTIRRVGPAHYACWSTLLSGLIFLLASIACGFARDIERNH
jgi:hypothetical protein